MNRCSNCNNKVTVRTMEAFEIKDLYKITYCHKCEYYDSIVPEISVFQGTALRGIDKRTGEFRFKIVKPKKFSKKEMIVQTFPKILVSTPSEWRTSGKSLKSMKLYKTKGRTKKVYPELKRKDEVKIADFLTENAPLMSIIMKNETLGLTSEFVVDEIQLKKGLFSSFSIRNPILAEAEKKDGKTFEIILKKELHNVLYQMWV